MEGRNWSLFEISETKSKLLDLKDQNQLTKFYGSSIYFTLNIALKPTNKFEFLKKKICQEGWFRGDELEKVFDRVEVKSR